MRRARIFLMAAAFGVAGACATTGPGGAADADGSAGVEIDSAHALLGAMHDRYADRWYRTLSFRQRVIRTPPDGSTVPEEVWLEHARVPGSLRIDFGAEYTGNGVLFSGDTLHVFRDGQPVQQVARRNPLMTLGFDVYAQPAERTAAQLEELGFDLSRFHEATYDGRPAYVVGAAPGDDRTRQFWVEADRLLFVRMIEPLAQDTSRTSEIVFADYEPLEGGWIAPLVLFNVDGRETMREEYYDIVGNPEIPVGLFDPSRWSAGADAGR